MTATTAPEFVTTDDGKYVCRREVETLDDLPTEAEAPYTADLPTTPAEIAKANLRRAAFASNALIAYATSSSAGGEPPETVLSDLLADLRHLADVMGVDFDGLDGLAEMHYVPETRGEL